MSEKMLRILLSEVKTVRVTCKRCKVPAVVEIPIDRLDMALGKHTECRFCGHDFFSPAPGVTNPLNDLRLAVAELKRIETDLGIEFEISQP